MPFYVVEHGTVEEEQVESVMGLEPYEPDAFGVKYYNAFVTDQNVLFTVANAANVNMIIASHKRLGLPVTAEDIHPVWIGSLPTT